MADTEETLAKMRGVVERLRSRGLWAWADVVEDGASIIESQAAELDRVKVSFAKLAAKSSEQADAEHQRLRALAENGQIEEALSQQRQAWEQKHVKFERLTLKPMTLEEAVAVMNDRQYLLQRDWKGIENDEVYSRESGEAYTEFEAIAIAEKLVREKEAARG